LIHVDIFIYHYCVVLRDLLHISASKKNAIDYTPKMCKVVVFVYVYDK